MPVDSLSSTDSDESFCFVSHVKPGREATAASLKSSDSDEETPEVVVTSVKPGPADCNSDLDRAIQASMLSYKREHASRQGHAVTPSTLQASAHTSSAASAESKRVTNWKESVNEAESFLVREGHLHPVTNTKLWRFLQSQQTQLAEYDEHRNQGHDDLSWNKKQGSAALKSERTDMIRPLIDAFSRDDDVPGNRPMQGNHRSQGSRRSQGSQGHHTNNYLRALLGQECNIPNGSNVVNQNNLALCQGLYSFIQTCFETAIKKNRPYLLSRCPCLLLLLHDCMAQSCVITMDNYKQLGLKKLTPDMALVLCDYFTNGSFPLWLAHLGNF